MPVEVILEEKPRSFDVSLGYSSIGIVTSFIDDKDELNDEDPLGSYLAEVYDNEGNTFEVGWFYTLKAAAQAVIEYEHGGTVDKIIKRKA